MAEVNDSSRRFGKDVISTNSNNPEEAQWANQLYNIYMGRDSSVMTSVTLHLECSNWLSHGFNIPVSNPDGLTESEAIERIKEEYPVCPKCGKNWKKIYH